MALQKLPKVNQCVNVICWDQGESDPELDYLQASLSQVINRYQTTLNGLGYYNSAIFGYIAVSTTGELYIDTNIKVNDVLETLNRDSLPFTKYIIATDLPVAIQAGTTNTPDIYHFNSSAQRVANSWLKPYKSV